MVRVMRAIAVLLMIAIVDAQVVNVTVFTESQCKYCTLLFREQLWPFHNAHPGVMNLEVIPFGKGNCEMYRDRTLHCQCMHGPTECDLNRLQNCAIYFFPRQYFGLLVCIQGLRDLREAFDRCLSRLSPQTQQKLIDCSTTQTGEILNYYSMLNTHRAGIKLWPAMYVNGRYFDRSYPAENEICSHTSWC